LCSKNGLDSTRPSEAGAKSQRLRPVILASERIASGVTPARGEINLLRQVGSYPRNPHIRHKILGVNSTLTLPVVWEAKIFHVDVDAPFSANHRVAAESRVPATPPI